MNTQVFLLFFPLGNRAVGMLLENVSDLTIMIFEMIIERIALVVMKYLFNHVELSF